MDPVGRSLHGVFLSDMAQNTYATFNDLILAYDRHLVAELSSDEPGASGMSGTNVIATRALERASADIEAFLIRAGRYSTDDLETLQSESNTLLIGLTCDLAMGHLYARRGKDVPAAIQGRLDGAMETLKGLRDGSQILRDTPSITAGKVQVSVISPSKRVQRGFVSDEPFFPSLPQSTV